MKKEALTSPAAPAAAIFTPRVIDRIEQGAALLLYAFLIARVWPKDLTVASIASSLVLVSEGLIVLFLIIRRPTAAISLRPQDWVVAFAGTVAPLLVVRAEAPLFLAAGVYLWLLGTITHLGAKMSLFRSFGLVAANRGVKTGGAYRYVRHPMYLGYMISHAGFMLISPSLWNFAVYAVAWTCLILRIRFEERVLSDDAGYRAFKERTRWRLLPGVW